MIAQEAQGGAVVMLKSEPHIGAHLVAEVSNGTSLDIINDLGEYLEVTWGDLHGSNSSVWTLIRISIRIRLCDAFVMTIDTSSMLDGLHARS